VSNGLGALAVTLLSDGELDTLALGKGDPGLLVVTNDENVGLAGGERVVNGVLKVDNVEASIVTLTVGDDTNTAHVTTTGDHGNGASVELDEVGDLAGLEVNLDGVVDLDEGVGKTDTVVILATRIFGKTYQPSDFRFCSVSSRGLPTPALSSVRHRSVHRQRERGRGSIPHANKSTKAWSNG